MLSRFFNQHVPTSAGAIVMATGILLLGAMQKLVIHHKDFAIVSTILVILLLIILYIAFLRDLVRGLMWERHLHDPIASFGIGTWVAATSVTVLVIMNFVPSLKSIAFLLFFINCILSVGYVTLMIRNYLQLFNPKASGLREKVHGILLLACVAVQSIIAEGQALYGKPFVTSIGTWLWWFGLLLYIFGLVLILNRYIRSRNHNLAHNWMNTNCILHGAMSISGLVGATTGVVSPSVLSCIWIWVIVAFVVVEGIEIARSILRIRQYGWKQGMWVYHTSQWARNFTFGMLLAFSMHLHIQGKLLYLLDVKNIVLLAGPYIVMIMFALEVLIAFTGRPYTTKIPETVNI